MNVITTDEFVDQVADKVLERLAEDLKPFATVESAPKLEGRNMLMLLAPIKGAFDEKPEKSESDKK